MAYYPFIDGLRALAVLLVVLFHLDLGFTGGFIGVDVFFVISGFLITSLILKDLQIGEFRLACFWERRARRILPALLVVVAASIFAGWFLLLPRDFLELGWSVLAQSVFLQNVVFWAGEGYFAAPSESKPLLHTWSLAVEEQFYFAYPLLMALVGLRTRRFWLLALSGIACASFAVSAAAVAFTPGAAFYFLPSRAWELLLGALLAVVPTTFRLPRFLSEAGTYSGLFAVLASASLYSADTPFPGLAAAAPCAGAALIIWLNRDRRASAARILEWSPLVFVGLVSYSFYLWHWPIIVFSRYWEVENMSTAHKVLLLLASFSLACLSWKYVERPFRRGGTKLHSRRKVFAWSVAGLFGCALFGTLMIAFEGFKARLPSEVLRHDAVAREELFRSEMSVEDLRKGNWTNLGARMDGEIGVVVWGDSMAMAICPAIDEICREAGLRGAAITRSSTAPLLGFSSMGQYALKEESVAFADLAVDLIARARPRVVILTASWSGYTDAGDPSGARHKGDFWQSLGRTVTAVRDAGSAVWIVLEPPAHKHHVPVMLARESLWGIGAGSGVTTPEAYEASSSEFRRRLAARFGDHARIIEPAEVMKATNVDGSSFFRIKDDAGNALYRDHIHLSSHGARFVGRLFSDLLKPNSESPDAVPP